jgi:hypothetical protein
VRRTLLFPTVVLIVVALALVFSSLVLAQSGPDSRPGAVQVFSGQGVAGDDSSPQGPAQVVIPAQYLPTAAQIAEAAAGGGGGGTATVYFTPQDENTSTTVLFLYNTTPVTATVGLRSYYLNGSLTLSTNIAVPPSGMVRICADSVSTISASWANTVLVNFTTFSAYAAMDLPTGVKADGYVAWDTTGVYDPLTSMQTLPLRFSADPATVFMPAISR